jgi:hypothetical protein
MERRSPLVRASLLFTVTAIVAACASAGSGGSGPYSYGFLVPGATVASAFRIGATDTIAELPGVSSIPTAVRTGITQETITGRFDSTCTRRFGNSTIYPVIFFRSCNPSRGTEADPVVLIGFGPDGRKVGTVQWSGSSTVALLNPFRRF